MHDEMLTLFDDCIAHMLILRDRLAAARRVEPGERQATVLAAIAAAEHFATAADRNLAGVRSSALVLTPGTATRG